MRLMILMLLAAVVPALAAAQPFATIAWQLQPFCNRVSLTINRDGGVYTLDGFDDQCGASQRAPLVGTAVPNPDGTIGLAFTVTVPPARALQVNARVNPATGSGTWVDSFGNAGVFALNAATAGAPRPIPTGGLPWGTIIQSPVSPTFPIGLAVIVNEPAPSVGGAIVAQWGEAPASSPSSPSALRGVSADQFGVLGVSTTSAGVAGTSASGSGMSGESSTGPGVFGLSFGGPGVMAMNGGTGTGVALEVNNGALRVTGAVTPAFLHTATVANIAGHITGLDHPLLNDQPDVMLFVTRVFGGPGGGTVNITSPIGVFYDGTRWAIYREDGAPMPINTRFNVLVVSR